MNTQKSAHPRFDEKCFKIRKSRAAAAEKATSPMGGRVAKALCRQRTSVLTGKQIRLVVDRAVASETDAVKLFQDQRARFERAGFISVLK